MMFFLFIWSVSALGFIALATSMSKHQKQIFGKELDAGKTRLATLAGWGLLIVALIFCLFSSATSNMVSYWLGSLTFAAFVIGLSLTYLEDKIKVISMGLIIIAFVSGLINLF